MTRKPIKTDAQVRALKAAERPYFVPVADYPGLRVKVTESRGRLRRTFYCRFKRPDGKQELLKLGDYPEISLADARDGWLDARRDRNEHGSARLHREREKAERFAALKAEAAAAEQSRYTVRKLAAAFVDFQSGQIKTWKKTQQNLERYALPVLGDLPAAEVKRRDIVAMLDQIAAGGHIVTRNRVQAAVSAMFAYGVERELGGLETNPAAGIRKPKEASRERFLSDVELRRLFKHLPETDLHDYQRDLIEFILLTGCRVGEAAGMAYREIDEDAALWVLPAERAKNGRELRLPLSDQALALLEARRGKSPYVFPMERDPKRPMRADNIQNPLKDAIPTLKVLPFTAHDLRRTVQTGLGTLGCSRFIQDRITNHVDRTVGAAYDRADYTPQMREWLQLWADHLDTIRPAEKARKAEAG